MRQRVAEALRDAPTETALRERLRESHIDLYLRRNDTGRITGVTFIDHENRCVLNGSRLGKEYSANVVNERLAGINDEQFNQRQYENKENNSTKNKKRHTRRLK